MIFGMRRLLPALVLVASAVSVPAFAADWVYIAESISQIVSIDRTSIRQVGGYKRAWIRTEYRQLSNGYQRTIGLHEVDCQGGRFRTVQFTHYYPDGRTNQLRGDQVWNYAAPETTGESIVEFVCSGRILQ